MTPIQQTRSLCDFSQPDTLKNSLYNPTVQFIDTFINLENETISKVKGLFKFTPFQKVGDEQYACYLEIDRQSSNKWNYPPEFHTSMLPPDFGDMSSLPAIKDGYAILRRLQLESYENFAANQKEVAKSTISENLVSIWKTFLETASNQIMNQQPNKGPLAYIEGTFTLKIKTIDNTSKIDKSTYIFDQNFTLYDQIVGRRIYELDMQ